MGGALSFLASSSGTVNLVNNWDVGRLVQQSYYGNPDGSVWPMDGQKLPWRWNPVQGGSWDNQPGVLLGHAVQEDGRCFATYGMPRNWAGGQVGFLQAMALAAESPAGRTSPAE